MPQSNRQVTLEEVSVWCQEFKISSIIETSAKTSKNVAEAFTLAVRQWQQLERTTDRELRAQGDTIDLTRGVHLPQTERPCCNTSFGSNSCPPTPRHETFH